MLPPRLLRQIVVAVAIGAAVALGLALAANLPATLDAMGRFRWRLAPIVVLAVVTNYALRFAKWHYYLHLLAIPLGWRPSLRVFVAGFTMSITPAKLGEVLKAVLVRDLTGAEISRTASVVLAERLTDVAGLLILSAFGVTVLPHGLLLLGVVTVAVLAIVGIVWTPALARAARRAVPERLVAGRLIEPARRFLVAGRALLAPRALACAVLLSVVSWFFEGAALYVILQGLGAPVSLRGATVVYAFASLAGALSMLPGGLGVAEGSLTALLAGLGTPWPAAAAATLLVRVATLWLAVGLGVATLLVAFRGAPIGAVEPSR